MLLFCRKENFPNFVCKVTKIMPKFYYLLYRKM